MKLYIDIETRSRLDVKRYGPYRHSECPDFAILMAAWSLDGAPVKVATTYDEIAAIPGLRDRDVTIVAHNAGFERICLGWFLTLLHEKYPDPSRFRCTMALAGEHGLPQSLKECAKALGAPDKDEAGARLISLFCKPNRKGGWNDATTHPAEWADFVAYCAQDVETLLAIDAKLEWPSEDERLAWVANERVNDLGIPADRAMAEQAMAAAEENTLAAKARITELSGVDNPGSQQQMMAWAKRVGLELPNLQAGTIANMLAAGDLDPEEREVLTLRTEVAQAATKKYSALLDRLSPDDRLRGEFRFFGAHTGRFSGRGVQLQNLPRASLSSQAHVDAARLDLAMGLGADAYTLKALVRSTFVGPFTVVDYAAIEARVIAWLANERWALQAFRDGRDIYVETAERLGPEFTRQQGKTAVLAFGYQGSVGAARRMGYGGQPCKDDRGGKRFGREPGEGHLCDEQIRPLVDAWRQANRRIVAFWGDLQDAINSGGTAGRAQISRRGSTMYLHLPSGRKITYRGMSFDRYRVFDEDTEEWIEKASWRFRDPRKNGARTGIYGGLLAENITQAVARDLLTEALVRLQDHGYRVVAHIHDECVLEGEHDVEQVKRVMCETPSWGEGLPVDGEGEVMDRYRKG